MSRVAATAILIVALAFAGSIAPATATSGADQVAGAAAAGSLMERLRTSIVDATATAAIAMEAARSIGSPGDAAAGNGRGGRTPGAVVQNRPFSMNLYRKGDFVHQQTPYWCVAASVQTMMNIIDNGKPNRSARFQKKLHFQGRDLDRTGDAFWRDLHGPARWKRGLHGLGLNDWAGLLTVNGYGSYEVERASSLKKAVRMAARAIRETGRPAGLVVWRGAHAWVMSGFEATADPAVSDRFKVKKVFIQDPWYPDVSSIWGRSRPPNAAVSPKALRADFLRYNRPGRRHPMRDGKYMLILPTQPDDGAGSPAAQA